MRVLFTVSPWPTHYMAMVPLAWALRSTGHDVRVLCTPSQVAAVTQAGLLAAPVLDGMGIAVHNRLSYVYEALDGEWPYPWPPLHPVTGAELASLDDFDLDEYRTVHEPRYAAQAAASYDAAVDYARWWRPDLVLHDPVCVEGLLAARVVGVPSVLALWGPVGTHEDDGPVLLPEDISGSFPRYGLGAFGPDLVDHAVDPCPAPIEPPVKAQRLPVRYIPYNGGGQLPALAAKRRPRVCVTWSTALTTMSGPRSYLLPDIVAALSGLDIEVVLTATRADVAALGEVPPGVRVLERCPIAPLLDTCDAVVHHGGAGSTMTAMTAGVPQLTLTFASEQARVGGRVAAAGAAIAVPGHLADRDTIRGAMSALLTEPRYREAALALGEESRRRPTPAELVSRLDELAH